MSHAFLMSLNLTTHKIRPEKFTENSSSYSIMANLKEYLPLLAMIIVEINYTWTNIFSKAALNSGMSPYVLIAYRQFFATLSIAPFAFFLERNSRPAMTKKIMLQTVFCSVVGGALTTLLSYVGLKYTTATIASAGENTLPVLTYIIGVIARLEKLSFNDRKGQAKLFGTLVTVGGALLLSFYNGPVVNIPKSKIEWRFIEAVHHGNDMTNKETFFGPLMIFSSCLSAALWMMVQTKLSQSYRAPFTNTFLMCFFSLLPTTVISLSLNHRLSDWSLKSPIRLVAALCSGIASSAVGFLLMSFAAGEKGPLYVSIFSPLLLVMVAFLSWALLEEQLVLGTLVGSVLIVLGLYTVLWGKNKELEDATDAGG